MQKQTTIDYISSKLRANGFEMDPSAMRPFDRIPFEKLHSIYDREESFLKKHIIDSITEEFKKRTNQEIGQLTETDVFAGILSLGKKVQDASSEEFDQKQLIRDACPYC